MLSSDGKGVMQVCMSVENALTDLGGCVVYYPGTGLLLKNVASFLVWSVHLVNCP